MTRVCVVTGSGGMGVAIARRVGRGRTVLLADLNEAALKSATALLISEGYDIVPCALDVADPSSVEGLASKAANVGTVEVLVHTAGLSPAQASAEAILSVDLYGTALVLDAFGQVISAGGAGVCIASMAATLSKFDGALEYALKNTPTEDLPTLSQKHPQLMADPATAYMAAKRSNQLRVMAASVAWGHRNARINSVSPGIISTPMGLAELSSPIGTLMQQMIETSGTGRIGTPDDIAAAVEFLTNTGASFVTGIDLLVDGGVVAVASGATSG
jgi:NAD(P)-dependent dehydrogenase (short-subunit alcohol dehydrogenase family)